MSPSRTTKPASKARRAAACLLALAAAAWAGGAAAESPARPLRIRLEPASAGTLPMSRQITLYGNAPARCAPEVARVALDGFDLAIELKIPQTGCDARHLLPFGLRVDPAATAGMPLLPGQVYRARVYAVDGAGTANLLAFRLLDTGLGAAPTPENGIWWSEASPESGPASAGSGASIEFQNGQLAVGLFGFSETGAATWYFGSARPEGRVASVALVQLANGDPPFAPAGSKPVAQAGPRLEIEFLSPSRARGYLVRSDGGRDAEVRTLTLARSRFAGGAVGNTWNGQWVLVPDEGAPRTFEFSDTSTQDAETFHLVDAGSDARLDCRLAGNAQRPELCTLTVAAATLADFDQIGIDTLSGRSADGAAVKLLRVPR
jgi:hypothetical protein